MCEIAKINHPTYIYIYYIYIYTYKWPSVAPIWSGQGCQLMVQVWMHCTFSRSFLFVLSFCTPIRMTQHMFIKLPFVEQNPHGICNLEEVFVFACDPMRVISHSECTHTCKVTITTSRPPLTTLTPLTHLTEIHTGSMPTCCLCRNCRKC